MTVRAPAKINLHLGVQRRRPDGYHELATVFHAVSLFDDVTALPAPALGAVVRGEGASTLPVDDGNLAVRAARLVADAVGVAPRVRLELVKSIPVAAGLAGGSADGAAALLACDQLWGGRLDRGTLLDLAGRLGSDVPFALHGGTALGTGRGERLTDVLARGQYHWVLAFADGGLATADVYAEHDRAGDAGGRAPDGVLAALRQGDPVALGRVLHNDLQPAALRLRPALRRVLDAGRELGALGGVVSGSGPTVALLARTGAEATAIASSLAGMGLCRAVRRAHGPVAGARLLGDDG